MTDTAGRGEWCLARSCRVGASVERSDGGVPRDPVTGWIPAFGDLCIISFLPLQGEVPEGGGGTAPPSAICYLGQEDPLVSSLSPREQVFPGAKRGAVDRFPLGL